MTSGSNSTSSWTTATQRRLRNGKKLRLGLPVGVLCNWNAVVFAAADEPADQRHAYGHVGALQHITAQIVNAGANRHVGYEADAGKQPEFFFSCPPETADCFFTILRSPPSKLRMRVRPFCQRRTALPALPCRICPSLAAGTPFTMTQLIPAGGRIGWSKVARSSTVSGSKTTTSASLPMFSRPLL